MALTLPVYADPVRRALLLLSVLCSLAFAGEAGATEVLSQDGEGRTIHFDVQADGVDAEWYAALLRAAPHGDEISTVTIDIVSWEAVKTTCGEDAGGCYSRDVIVVPAEQSDEVAHIVVHEFGHHVDHSTSVAGVPEPNGTPEWWRARGMAKLLSQRSVARNYDSGWNRNIAEIYAEDYAQLALAGRLYAIGWLPRPDATVLAALKADFGLGPPPAVVTPPQLKPVTLAKHGSLAPKRVVAIDFGLLGPGRRVTATATFRGATETRARAVLEIRCRGARVALRTIGKGTTTVSIDRRNLGPANCTATLTSSSPTSRAYALRVVLSIPNA